MSCVTPVIYELSSVRYVSQSYFAFYFSPQFDKQEKNWETSNTGMLNVCTLFSWYVIRNTLIAYFNLFFLGPEIGDMPTNCEEKFERFFSLKMCPQFLIDNCHRIHQYRIHFGSWAGMYFSCIWERKLRPWILAIKLLTCCWCDQLPELGKKTAVRLRGWERKTKPVPHYMFERRLTGFQISLLLIE